MFKKCMGSQNKFDGLSLTNSLWAENNSFLGTPLGEASQFGHLKCWRLYQLWIKIRVPWGRWAPEAQATSIGTEKCLVRVGTALYFPLEKSPTSLASWKWKNSMWKSTACHAGPLLPPYPTRGAATTLPKGPRGDDQDAESDEGGKCNSRKLQIHQA